MCCRRKREKRRETQDAWKGCEEKRKVYEEKVEKQTERKRVQLKKEDVDEKEVVRKVCL